VKSEYSTTVSKVICCMDLALIVNNCDAAKLLSVTERNDPIHAFNFQVVSPGVGFIEK